MWSLIRPSLWYIRVCHFCQLPASFTLFRLPSVVRAGVPSDTEASGWCLPPASHAGTVWAPPWRCQQSLQVLRVKAWAAALFLQEDKAINLPFVMRCILNTVPSALPASNPALHPAWRQDCGSPSPTFRGPRALSLLPWYCVHSTKLSKPYSFHHRMTVYCLHLASHSPHLCLSHAALHLYYKVWNSG